MGNWMGTNVNLWIHCFSKFVNPRAEVGINAKGTGFEADAFWDALDPDRKLRQRLLIQAVGSLYKSSEFPLTDALVPQSTA